MTSKEILESVRRLTKQERRELKHEYLVEIMKQLSLEERMELSGIIGYPVLNRICMGEIS